MKALEVKNLTKDFSFSVKTKGSFIKNLFNPNKKIVHAVADISFFVPEGQIIAFIGPNGAGKSTTIKILTGILYPTSGDVSVLGFNPTKDRKNMAYKIGTVFGQRSQLLFNLPLTDSFELFGRMYDLTKKEIEERSKELIEQFDLDEFVDQPVRKLSLGQRMRAEVAVSLIHKPRIIFLDEPTIGLDIVAKRQLREVLLDYNKKYNTTIFLTSHDVGDIEALAQRVMIINHGIITLDATPDELKLKYHADEKTLEDIIEELYVAPKIK